MDTEILESAMQAVPVQPEVFEAHMTRMESGGFSYAGPHPHSGLTYSLDNVLPSSAQRYARRGIRRCFE
jgi:hypothetical protein